MPRPLNELTRAMRVLLFVGLAMPVVSLGEIAARADVVPNGLFGSEMVLQRDMPVPVWGTSAPGERVRVEFAGAMAETTADAQGRWKAMLPALVASAEPRPLIIRGGNTTTLDDVVVGDVWLCSGQSNMAYTMAALERKPDYARDLETANFPLIRQGTVAREPAVEPAASVPVKWVACSPATVKQFTAAGFYFAREIHADQKVPVGLILSAWGGTSAESWISPAALDTVPRFKARAAEQHENLQNLPARINAFPAGLAAWEQANGRVDADSVGEAAGWATGGDGWAAGKLGSRWSDLGLPDGGIAWIRKTIPVPAPKAGTGFRLDLGQVNEQYLTAYWNGRKLGEFGRKPPSFYKAYTHFDVPAADVKQGDNMLALRFTTHFGDRAPLTRSFRDIGLKNLAAVDDACEVNVERRFPPLDAAARAARPKTPEGDAAHTSGTLYCGMIHPLAPCGLKGVLWYQGEGDGSRGYDYRSLLPLLITSWREAWWGREVPFIVQQLPNWKASGARDTGWAEVREAQAMTATALPGVGVAIATEIGETDDVHPANKRDIGHRLALVALERVYRRDVKSSGPVMTLATRDGAAYRIAVTATGSLRTLDGAPPRYFALAGEDRVFHDAEAAAEGDAVVVRCAAVPVPAAVRYAWVNDTAGANLTDDTGLPMPPFRSDSWPIRGEE